MNFKMVKISIRIFVLFISFIILFNEGCKKSDDSELNLTNGKTSAIFNSKVSYGTLTDQDGNIYKTVTIGTQTWMAENLRTTKYNDGTNIPLIDYISWQYVNTGAFCNFNKTKNVDTIATYGRLYNWYAASTGKLAPKGWHVPTDEDWMTLSNFLGGESVAGGKLKEAETVHWEDVNTGATNETGFTALPGGILGSDMQFVSFGFYGFWWSATEEDETTSWAMLMHRYRTILGREKYNKYSGLSVRCIKD
jgi:uncharacterized protein (TIGR02145 family)